MNQRQYVRNIGRIPRLLFHIKRLEKKAPDRVPGFKEELERRKYEMLAAGHGELLKELLKIKLEPHATADSEKLKVMVANAKKGMKGGIAELSVPIPDEDEESSDG